MKKGFKQMIVVIAIGLGAYLIFSKKQALAQPEPVPIIESIPIFDHSAVPETASSLAASGMVSGISGKTSLKANKSSDVVSEVRSHYITEQGQIFSSVVAVKSGGKSLKAKITPVVTVMPGGGGIFRATDRTYTELSPAFVAKMKRDKLI